MGRATGREAWRRVKSVTMFHQNTQLRKTCSMCEQQRMLTHSEDGRAAKETTLHIQVKAC